VQAHVVSPPTTSVISVGVRTFNKSLESFNFRDFILNMFCNTDAVVVASNFETFANMWSCCLHSKRTAAHGSRVATHHPRGACVKQDSDQCESIFACGLQRVKRRLQKIAGVE